MHALRKASEKKEKAKEDKKLKKSSYNISTPRDYLHMTSSTEIYGEKKSSLLNAPKKVVGSSSVDKTSPMKGYLKSSSSTASVASKTVSDNKKSKDDPSVLRKLNLPNELKTDSVKRNDKVSKEDSARRSTNKTMTGTHESSRKSKEIKETETKRIKNDVTSLNKSKDIASSLTPESIRKLKVTKQNVAPESIAKTKESSRKITQETPRKVRSIPHTNVTVNSPPIKKKNPDFESVLERGDSKKTEEIVTIKKDIETVRQRTKTRTLDENEVKMLTPDALDNNAEIKNLSKRLSATPKAFFVNLDDGGKKDKSSDEDYSYEDDFESYESDFESYHSSATSASEKENNDDASERGGQGDQIEDGSLKAKNGKDEEKMLDSGSFELRESQRSANRTKPGLMENILEDSEDPSEKKTSFTDEGFQEMSSSSAVSSMKMVHVDVLDRPLFMDFTKSKENKKKKKANEMLKQRAKDLLSLITLHEMSYSLFEMKPIPYEMYMATFGRSNYTQIAVQTFDDGVAEEVQTEEILCETKWTQHPIEFSHHDVYLNPKDRKKSAKNEDDYLTKFSILLNKEDLNVDLNNEINVEKDYKMNPLRIYFEQKDGAGPCEVLPYEKYKAKVEDKDFNVARLSKFLKKVESRVCNIMNENKKDLDVVNTSQNTKLPFSKGYVSICTKTITSEQLSFVKSAKISRVFFSETNPHLLMTSHQPVSFGGIGEKSLICLWDVNVARNEPLKVLVAIDNVTIGRYRGDTDGIVVAALNDGSLHLWDLSEEPTLQIASSEKSTNLLENETDQVTSQTEIDREWNFKNSNNKDCDKPQTPKPLQSCAYTSSAYELTAGLVAESVTGLLLMTDSGVLHGGGRKLVGQVCVLQRIGKLIIWSIVQERTKSNPDMGKAYWSKTKLEKLQIISLMDQFDIQNLTEGDKYSFFNLNAAKKRLTGKRLDKKIIRQSSRPKSAVSFNSSEFDIDRPASAVSVRSTVLPTEKTLPPQLDIFSWESGVICNDLKVMKMNDVDNYLVAKNRGEVLICTRVAGVARVQRFSVAKDMSSVTCVDTPRHALPYFLAATDSGTINLCCLTDSRVLLTLNCSVDLTLTSSNLGLMLDVKCTWLSPGHTTEKNGPPIENVEKCQSDHLGRFVKSSRPARAFQSADDIKVKLSITNLHWSHSNPCLLYCTLQNGAVLSWELTYSDIAARAQYPKAVITSAQAGNSLALLTPEGEVQIHRLTNDQRNSHYLDLFQKYVALL